MVISFPPINASLNFLSLILLLAGYFCIRSGRKDAHKIFMLLALLSSSAFLICYLIYHFKVGSVAYPYDDWTRILYFIILIPHVILATLMVPFILILVYHAAKQNWIKHVYWAKRVFPVWVYVSLSGVLVYLMLYQF